jgi:hypothetical protein
MYVCMYDLSGLSEVLPMCFGKLEAPQKPVWSLPTPLVTQPIQHKRVHSNQLNLEQHYKP